MVWIYLFRPLNHVHCVMPKGFRAQVQACLDKAQLSSHYSSGHSVMKKQIKLKQIKSWSTARIFFYGYTGSRACLIRKAWIRMRKKNIKNKIKNKIKTPKHWVFQKVLFHEKVKQNINILNAGKESDLWVPSPCWSQQPPISFTASLPGILLGHGLWQHGAKVLTGVSSSVKCHLSLCMGSSVQLQRTCSTNAEQRNWAEQWPSIVYSGLLPVM